MSAERRFCRDHPPDSRSHAGLPRRGADSDFQGLEEPLRIVLDAKPNVLNHNTETVRVSIEQCAREPLPAHARSAGQCQAMGPRNRNKSGVMVGIGEETGELIEVFRDLGACGVDILTIGQYLRPSKDHLPMTRYYTPANSSR